MEAKQLELFGTKPQLVTKFKIWRDWVLVDNRDRDIEKSIKLKYHYPLVVNLNNGEIHSSSDGESRILPSDKNAKKIDITSYLKVSNLLRLKKMIYNKKKFQLEKKR